MDFSELQKMGGLVASAPVRKELTFLYHAPKPEAEWQDAGVPEFEDDTTQGTATIFVRKRNSADFLHIVKAPEDQQAFIALHRCVCTEDGAPLFPSVDHASQLAEWLLIPMMNAVNEVNSFAPKRQTPRMISGMTSPSLSAVAALPSGNRQSRRKNAAVG